MSICKNWMNGSEKEDHMFSSYTASAPVAISDAETLRREEASRISALQHNAAMTAAAQRADEMDTRMCNILMSRGVSSQSVSVMSRIELQKATSRRF